MSLIIMSDLGLELVVFDTDCTDFLYGLCGNLDTDCTPEASGFSDAKKIDTNFLYGLCGNLDTDCTDFLRCCLENVALISLIDTDSMWFLTQIARIFSDVEGLIQNLCGFDTDCTPEASGFSDVF